MVPRAGRCVAVQLWDGRCWPADGVYSGLPVFRFRSAPSGLVTRRQLRAEGLRPAGQDVTGWLAWGRHRHPRWAALFRRDLAKPKRPMSPAQRAALAKANTARFARACARHGHEFGPWLACTCDQTSADHQDGFFADGSCAFEFRRCGWCDTNEEQHVASVPDMSGGVPDPQIGKVVMHKPQGDTSWVSCGNEPKTCR
jgi:hypothetical protein